MLRAFQPEADTGYPANYSISGIVAAPAATPSTLGPALAPRPPAPPERRCRPPRFPLLPAALAPLAPLTFPPLPPLRLLFRAPPLPAFIPAWQQLLAKISHFLMYACMVIMPVSGYLGSSFTKYPIKYFGYTLPHWGWDSPAYKEICSQVHYIAVWVFMTLIAIHFAAAVKHMIARDGVIQRMWR